MRRALVLLSVGACTFSPSPVGGGPGGDAGADAAPAGGDGPAADAGVDAPPPPVDAAPDCPPEACNGLDDDCDGLTDEDWAVGQACDGADADLCAEGLLVCAPGGAGTLCDDATADSIEVCTGAGDEDCDGRIDCQQASCCADAACAAGAYCCAGTGLVHRIGNLCLMDYGTSGSSDSLEVYCCGGVARLCLSGEVCPWRSGCAGASPELTCSRAGLAADLMGQATCERWRGQSDYLCSAGGLAYFGP